VVIIDHQKTKGSVESTDEYFERQYAKVMNSQFEDKLLVSLDLLNFEQH
jgi:hypothetical protein